jgi:hypothetical protein
MAGMDRIKPIPAIPNALARSDGKIKFPETDAQMPHGGWRQYKTKWVRGTIRKASKTARHEYYGTLYRGKNYKIHRLICEAFHGPAPKGKNVVIHLDEDATNNRPCNLKWGTQKENLNAAGFIAYCKSRTGENSPTTKGRRNRLDNSEL